MKHIFFLMIVFLCVGCKDNNRLSKEFEEIKKTPPIDSTNFNKIKLIESIGGVWVRKCYIDSLKLNMSPLKSFVCLEDISSIVVNESNVKETNIDIGLLYNNHEASNTKLIKKNNKLYISLYRNNSDSLVEVILNNSELKFSFKGQDYVFERVLSQFSYGEDAGVGIEHIVRKILFSKKVFFNSNISNEIIFKQNGDVEGFEDYNKYIVVTDFVTSPDPIDLLILKNLSKQVAFHFKFKKNDLLLYKYDEIQDDFILKYTLKPR